MKSQRKTSGLVRNFDLPLALGCDHGSWNSLLAGDMLARNLPRKLLPSPAVVGDCWNCFQGHHLEGHR